MRVVVFLDYANIDASSGNLRCKVDYGALLDYLANEEEQRSLIAAYAYVPIDPRQEHAMDGIIGRLWDYGYIVKSKVGMLAGNTYKCDFDVEMTLDMARTGIEMSPDIIVLVSGDSDFVPVILELRNRGIRVEVASFGSSMSDQLSHRCSGYINLDVLIEQGDEKQDSDEDDFENGDETGSANDVTGKEERHAYSICQWEEDSNA